jgi:3-dehydroquinate dehydratase
MLIPYEEITRKILLIRGKKVMLDRDLAEIYGVSTKVLNQAVKRNIERFPEDFMLKLTKTEKNKLVTICDRFKNLKHSAVNPYAFTEQGVAMLSSVLNSQRAIMVNIVIMRTFVKLRKILASHKDLLKKIEDIEKKYDSQFKVVFEAIRQLVREEEKPKINIGFK